MRNFLAQKEFIDIIAKSQKEFEKNSPKFTIQRLDSTEEYSLSKIKEAPL